jgi:hypothetical protein
MCCNNLKLLNLPFLGAFTKNYERWLLAFHVCPIRLSVRMEWFDSYSRDLHEIIDFTVNQIKVCLRLDTSSCFILLVAEPPEVIQCCRPNFISAAILMQQWPVSIYLFIHTDTASDRSKIYPQLKFVLCSSSLYGNLARLWARGLFKTSAPHPSITDATFSLSDIIFTLLYP